MGKTLVKAGVKFSFFILLLFLSGTSIFISCDFKKSENAGGTYVKPSIDYKGRMRKGYVRKKVSTNKNAIKNQNRSRYYYHTRGKYRRKKH
jgi:hypothetical protein